MGDTVSGSSTAPTRPPRRSAVVLALIAGVILVAVVGAGIVWMPVLSSVLSDFGARVADRETTLTLGDQDAPVIVAVPAGWVTRQAPLQHSTVVVTSPDHVLTVTITATASDGPHAFAEASEGAESVSLPVVEALGSGLSVMHARSGDDALIAAVGMPDGERSAVVVARTDGERLETYLPAVGQILDGLRVSS